MPVPGVATRRRVRGGGLAVAGLVAGGLVGCGGGSGDPAAGPWSAASLGLVVGVDPEREAERVASSLAPAGWRPLRRLAGGEPAGSAWVALSFRHARDPLRSALRVVTRRGVPLAVDADEDSRFVDLDLAAVGGTPGPAPGRLDLNEDGRGDLVLVARDASVLSRRAFPPYGRRCLRPVLARPGGFLRPLPPPPLGAIVPGSVCLVGFRDPDGDGRREAVGSLLWALPTEPEPTPVAIELPLGFGVDAAPRWRLTYPAPGLLPPDPDRQPSQTAFLDAQQAVRRRALEGLGAGGDGEGADAAVRRLALAAELALLDRLAGGELAAGREAFDEATAALTSSPGLQAGLLDRVRSVLYDSRPGAVPGPTASSEGSDPRRERPAHPPGADPPVPVAEAAGDPTGGFVYGVVPPADWSADQAFPDPPDLAAIDGQEGQEGVEPR